MLGDQSPVVVTNTHTSDAPPFLSPTNTSEEQPSGAHVPSCALTSYCPISARREQPPRASLCTLQAADIRKCDLGDVTQPYVPTEETLGLGTFL